MLAPWTRMGSKTTRNKSGSTMTIMPNRTRVRLGSRPTRTRCHHGGGGFASTTSLIPIRIRQNARSSSFAIAVPRHKLEYYYRQTAKSFTIFHTVAMARLIVKSEGFGNQVVELKLGITRL